jgi:UDP:flavonoid glycosyltransferase YjiC (YdhE family)
MKILLASTPATGHLNPLLAVARILIAEGHQVVGLSGSSLRDRIEGIGAKFRSLCGNADFDPQEIVAEIPELRPRRRGLNGCASYCCYGRRV